MMPALSLTSSPSSSVTTIKVEKATSELLVAPDWTINMEICDLFNSNHWKAKEVVKGVKRRLQHKNPKVQLLTLTLLETMVKNCGQYIHHQIADRKVLDEMVKIAKKKGDVQVRDRILILVDSWQEAFGGPSAKHSQYYWACDELRRSGARFPQRSQQTAPVITPSVTQQPRVPQIGYGGPTNSSRRLEEALTSEVEGLSFSTLESMRNVLELFDDMLQAVNPNDRMSVKDEIIVDLVEHCRTNQKKLMQMITTTTDEDLLAQGLKMNDSLQSVLGMHDAILSGAPLPDHGKRISALQNELVDSNIKISEEGDKRPTENGKSPVSDAPVTNDQVKDEDDELLLLSQSHSKTQSGPSQIGTSGVTEDGASSSGSNNVLALLDAPPVPETTTKTSQEQDLIDLLSLVLTTSSTSETTQAPNPPPAQNTSEASSDSYVVPWAQAQAQAQAQPQTQQQNTMQSLPLLQNQYQPMQPQMQPQMQPCYSQYGSTYPPPPWEATSGYNNHQNLGSNPYMYPNYQGIMNNAQMPMQGGWPSQNVNAFQYPQYGNQPMYPTSQATANFYPTQGNGSFQHSNSFQNPPSMNGNTSALNGTTLMTNGSAFNPSGQQKPFVPSYRLFEDLNVLGSSEGKLKNGPYPSASGN